MRELNQSFLITVSIFLSLSYESVSFIYFIFINLYNGKDIDKNHVHYSNIH